MTKISHIPWGGYDKGFYGNMSTIDSLNGKWYSEIQDIPTISNQQYYKEKHEYNIQRFRK